jgi:hypothetical protein
MGFSGFFSSSKSKGAMKILPFEDGKIYKLGEPILYNDIIYLCTVPESSGFWVEEEWNALSADASAWAEIDPDAPTPNPPIIVTDENQIVTQQMREIRFKGDSVRAYRVQPGVIEVEVTDFQLSEWVPKVYYLGNAAIHDGKIYAALVNGTNATTFDPLEWQLVGNDEKSWEDFYL